MDNFDLFDLKPSKTIRQKRRDKRLHEEVIETGRFKTAKSARNIKKWNESGRKKTLQHETSIDSVRFRESIRDGRSVRLRDNLEPLERWLHAQIGHPWAAVYAELGQIANPNSMHGAHIRQHLWQFVAKKSWLDEAGELVIADSSGGLGGLGTCWPKYFIHPQTGIFSATEISKTEGAFPKKARFKMEKQAVKSKIRQNIDYKKTPEKPGLDLTNCPVFRTRQKWVKPGDSFDFLEKTEIFRAKIVKIAKNSGDKSYWLDGRWQRKYGDWLLLDLKIMAVFSGEKYQPGQNVPLWAFENDASKWTVFDEGRLFGNRGWAFKHWAMAQKRQTQGTIL